MSKNSQDTSEEADWKESDQENEDSADVGFLTEDEDFDTSSKERSKKRETPQKKGGSKSPKKAKVSNSAGAKKTTKKTKEEKGTKKELTEKQGYDVILKYINEQNKPFNAQTIFDNLHKEVKKAYVVRILAQLAQDGKIVEKEFGKSKVYFADQNQFPVVEESEFQKMDEEINGLEEEMKSLQNEIGVLKSEQKELDSALTDADLEKEISSLTTETQQMQERVNNLQGAEMIDPEELSKLREEVSRAEKIWKQRRSKCREIIGVMAEGMEKRDEEIAELIGLETEEELGIPLPFRR